MLTFRKRRSLAGLGLVLVGALLLAGCSPSSPAPNNDGPPSYGEEVYSQFMGSWRSPAGVVPAVEFTVGAICAVAKG